MEQLLRINMVPIAVDLRIDNAKLNLNNPLPKVDVTTQKGGLRIDSDPIKIKMDTFEMRQTIGMKSNTTLIKDFSNEGKKVARQVTKRYVDEGNALADPKGPSVGQMIDSRMKKNTQTVLDFLPKARPKISWSGGDVSIDYQMDKLNMEWDTTTQPKFDFVRGNFDVVVTQKPKVDIEYIGGPIYVPPSAAPDYKGQKLDLKI